MAECTNYIYIFWFSIMLMVSFESFDTLYDEKSNLKKVELFSFSVFMTAILILISLKSIFHSFSSYCF